MPNVLPQQDNLIQFNVVEQDFETLLLQGGDGRMAIKSGTGLSKYGCAPKVRDALPFGNCTASSPTETALKGAKDYLDRLRDAGTQSAVYTQADTLFNETRSALMQALALSPSCVDIAFCPSGTDAEILALALMRGASEEAVVNIISGQGEVGGGTASAAAGRYFNPWVPTGSHRKVGSLIDKKLSTSVKVHTIGLRFDDGQLRSREELDNTVIQKVEAALEANQKVLLHVLAHSKTGANAPSLVCVARLRDRYGQRVAVVIDAAQGRMNRQELNAALAKGFMVIITGSKFYGGPPFAGALLVPTEFWPVNTGIETLPKGLSDFFSAAELPESWTSLRRSLPQNPNIGLLLRWGAALAEMNAYYRVSAAHRLRVMSYWEVEAPTRLRASKVIDLLDDEETITDNANQFSYSKQSIFSFFVRRHSTEAALPISKLKLIFQWLNRDISGLLRECDDDQKVILTKQIHIGQPVQLASNPNNDCSVLRIALGGVLIRRVAEDLSLGSNFESRLDWLGKQLDLTCMKLELIVEHLDLLMERDSV